MIEYIRKIKAIIDTEKSPKKGPVNNDNGNKIINKLGILKKIILFKYSGIKILSIFKITFEQIKTNCLFLNMMALFHCYQDSFLGIFC